MQGLFTVTAYGTTGYNVPNGAGAVTVSALTSPVSITFAANWLRESVEVGESRESVGGYILPPPSYRETFDVTTGQMDETEYDNFMAELKPVLRSRYQYMEVVGFGYNVHAANYALPIAIESAETEHGANWSKQVNLTVKRSNNNV